MKKIIIILIPFLFLCGCLPSIIKVKIKNDPKPYEMFGKTPQRDFYIPITISDSLIQIWETDINGGLTNSSFTNYDSCVFINDLSGWVTCLDLDTGEHLGQIKNKGAVYSSPVINYSQIIFPVIIHNENYSELYYYSFILGEVIKKIKINGIIVSQLIKAKDGIIFNTEDGRLLKYNNNGNKIWETKTKVKCHSSPSMFNNIIFLGNDKGEILAINSSDGKIIYRKKIGSPFSGSSTISDSIGYLGNDNGILYAIKLSNGNIIWKFDSGSEIMTVPVMNKENLFLTNMSGEIFSLNKNTGKLIWSADIGGVINATPLLTDNYLIVPNLNSHLDFINVSNGKIIKSYKLEGHAKLSPVIIKNKLLIGFDNGMVRAYEIQ